MQSEGLRRAGKNQFPVSISEQWSMLTEVYISISSFFSISLRLSVFQTSLCQ